MPYVPASWRRWPQFRWLSRLWCFFGKHHWMRSRQLNVNLICVICHKQGIGYKEYADRFK